MKEIFRYKATINYLTINIYKFYTPGWPIQSYKKFISNFKLNNLGFQMEAQLCLLTNIINGHCTVKSLKLSNPAHTYMKSYPT